MLDKVIQKWNDILNYAIKEHSISDVSFTTWLKPLEIITVENNVIFLKVPDEMFYQYIQKKYYLPLKVAACEILGETIDIKFVIPGQEKALINKKEEPVDAPDIFEKSGLNPKYTFSSFVVGENNSMAHAAALAVAESPAEVYNPLFIYGGVGLGKTHLMQAIAHFILQSNPDLKVLYVTSETFTNEIIEAIRSSNNPSANAEFRRKYRDVDVLLIDDIQFISGKDATQQEFYHTFNELYENKKQIIISSDKPPKELDNLEERLCSRFLWGLPVDIQSPVYETRVAILKKKIELGEITTIPDEVVNYIAANVSSNIRELEGALTKIVAYSKLSSKKIDLPFAEDVLQDLFSGSQKEITPELILKIVAEHFNIPSKDIISSKRSQDIVYPRQIVMYLSRTYTDVSQSVIGKKLGNRDHTTIIHGCNKIQEALSSDEKVQNDIEILKKKIGVN